MPPFIKDLKATFHYVEMCYPIDTIKLPDRAPGKNSLKLFGRRLESKYDDVNSSMFHTSSAFKVTHVVYGRTFSITEKVPSPQAKESNTSVPFPSYPVYVNLKLVNLTQLVILLKHWISYLKVSQLSSVIWTI